MEYRPYYLAREWVRLGHEVTVIAASFSHVRSINPIMYSNWQRENIDGVEYIWVKTPIYSGNGYKRAVNIFSFVSQLYFHQKVGSPYPEMIIASSTYPLDIIPASQMARKFRAKLIFEVHDLWPLTLIEIGKMSPRHPFIQLLQWAEDYAYRTADHVVSILPKADSYMVQHGMNPEKFVYIPNGIDTSEWEGNNPLPWTVQQSLATLKERGKVLIGYIGSHGIANALDTILDAAQLLRDESIEFMLVGDGPEKSRLMNRCNRERLGNITFLDPVKKTEIPALLSSLDICYIGLKNEPLFRYGICPNKLIDYMMAGKPIIYAINAGNNMVDECQCGISIPPEDPQALANAARQLLLLTANEREQIGKRGRTYISTNHDYRVLADKFLKSVQ